MVLIISNFDKDRFYLLLILYLCKKITMDTNEISSSGFVTKDDAIDSNVIISDIKEIETKGYSSLYTGSYLGKKHILKGLKPEFKNKQFYENLLKKEFEISHPLDHPNIVKTIDFKHIPDLGNCIMMEYIDGITLKKFAERHRVAKSQSHRAKNIYDKIFNELLDAMEYFHSKQIIHRDLKPSNILITNNGNNVKIIDFGLSDTDSYLILKQAAGTKKYAAPEQLIPNNTIDCRADIYSLGIILRNNFPKSYRKIAGKCAQQDRDKRYSSANDIKKALRNRKIKNISIISIIVFILLFTISLFATKHYVSNVTYNINEKQIIAESSKYIDAQLKVIEEKINEGAVSNIEGYNELVKIWHSLTTSDINKWADQIPTDTPFHNDFINHWNTYLSDNIKDITVLYADWMRESFQLIFDNLKPGEEIVTDPENPGLFIIRFL